MTESQAFWPVDCKLGEPDFFVCMACLNEVFRSKLPIHGCPGCRAVSKFEAFTLESIQDWGTEELINKAQVHASGASASPPSIDVTSSSESSLPT